MKASSTLFSDNIVSIISRISCIFITSCSGSVYSAPRTLISFGCDPFWLKPLKSAEGTSTATIVKVTEPHLAKQDSQPKWGTPISFKIHPPVLALEDLLQTFADVQEGQE